ncbi:MAG: hypothetical protein WKF84_27620, partial [Pyrinomonadaceae bacterium]
MDLAGRRGEATKVLNELLELNERRYVTPAALAIVYIGLGDKDQSFVWLEKAYQERSYYIAYLKVYPIVGSGRAPTRASADLYAPRRAAAVRCFLLLPFVG